MIDEELKKSRQAWFWRRTTLHFALVTLSAMLFVSILRTDAYTWPLCIFQCVMVAAVAWLVTMYFAMVDSASKVIGVAKSIGEAVGDARLGDRDEGNDRTLANAV